MQKLSKIVLGLAVFVGFMMFFAEVKAEPVTRTILWDSTNAEGTLYTAYRDGVAVTECVDVTEKQCIAQLEPGANEYTVCAHNLWEEVCSAPFLSPSVPGAPLSVQVILP